MNINNFAPFLLIGIVGVFLILGSYVYLGYHEDVHERIFEDYGSPNISRDFDLLKMRATVTGYCTGTNHADCTKLQAFTEVFGYHVAALILNLWLMIGAMFILALLVALVVQWRRS